MEENQYDEILSLSPNKKCKSFFPFSKDLKIILYGVSEASKAFHKVLCNAGYTVVAFFDIRYKELNKELPVPAYSLIDHPYHNQEKDEFCIIIMLQNAVQHESIAIEFLEQGFHKVFFAPVRSRLKKEIAREFRFQYNILLTGQFHLLTSVPIFHKALFEQELQATHSIIRVEGQYIIIWCPTELLYSDASSHTIRGEQSLYANVPIYSIQPYVEMFQFLQGSKENMNEYLENYGIHSVRFKNLLTDADIVLQRKDLLEIYMEELNDGMDFFISSAPLAEWNETLGVFNLHDGHHRSIFLALQGFRYIPIKVSYVDFKRWNAPFPAGEVEKHLSTVSGSLPILHPRYKKVNARCSRDYLLQLELIQQYLGEEKPSLLGLLGGKSVLDVSNTFGYYARNAVRMRAKEVFFFSSDVERINIEEMIRVLEGNYTVSTLETWSDVVKRTYDSLFILDALKNETQEDKVHKIDCFSRICLEDCFVDIFDLEEMNIWQSYFKSSRCLKNIVLNGTMATLWVFQK